MKYAIYMEGAKFDETEFKLEEDFEKVVKTNSKMLFGPKTIYFDLKSKVDTKFLGAAIPDGFLFDFSDLETPEFYMVEAELAKHSFYGHIFPQITRFFAFFKDPKSRNNLIDKLFQFVKSNPKLEEEFKAYLGKKEIYKALKDAIENSQNILIIIDENKPEFEEIMKTYTDTWDKMVRIEILKQYTAKGRTIFTLNPDFENIGLVEPQLPEETKERYTENFHTEYSEPKVVKIYEEIKEATLKLDPNIKINPQKYYISFRKNRNFAFIDLRKKKIKIAIMLPYEVGKSRIKHHRLRQFTDSIQKFYGRSSFEITIENEENLSEVIKLVEEAYRQQNK